MSSLRWSLGSLDPSTPSGTLGRSGTLQRMSGELSSLSTLMMERAEATEHSDNIGGLYLELSPARDGSGSYQPGEMMRGEVWIRANNPTHIAAVNVKVKGRCHISIQPNNSTKTLESEQSYLKDTVVLVDKESGMSLESGLAKIPFSYPLAQNVPSSFMGKHGSIVYDMTAEVHEDNHSQPLQLSKQFSVSRPLQVDPGQTSSTNTPISKSGSTVVLQQACFPGRMYAQVKLNRRHHTPNTDLVCNARTWNNSNKPITSTNAAIRMTSKYKTKKGKSKTVTQYVCRKTDRWDIERGEGRVWKDVALRIPPYLPDSQLTGCDLITVQYHFVFSITTSRKSKRPLELVIPITIGAALPPATALAQELDALSAYGSLNYSGSVRSRASSRAASSIGDSMISIREAVNSDDDTQSQLQMNLDRHAAIKQYVEHQRNSRNSQTEDIGDHLQTLQARMVIQAVDEYKGKDRKIVSRKKHKAPIVGVSDPYIDNKPNDPQTLLAGDTQTLLAGDTQTPEELDINGQLNGDDNPEVNDLNSDSGEELQTNETEVDGLAETPNLNSHELSHEWEQYSGEPDQSSEYHTSANSEDSSDYTTATSENSNEIGPEMDNHNYNLDFVPHRVSTIVEENEVDPNRNSNVLQLDDDFWGTEDEPVKDREGELFQNRLWKKQLLELNTEERNALEAFSVLHESELF